MKRRHFFGPAAGMAVGTARLVSCGKGTFHTLAVEPTSGTLSDRIEGTATLPQAESTAVNPGVQSVPALTGPKRLCTRPNLRSILGVIPIWRGSGTAMWPCFMNEASTTNKYKGERYEEISFNVIHMSEFKAGGMGGDEELGKCKVQGKAEKTKKVNNVSKEECEKFCGEKITKKNRNRKAKDVKCTWKGVGKTTIRPPKTQAAPKPEVSLETQKGKCEVRKCLVKDAKEEVKKHSTARLATISATTRTTGTCAAAVGSLIRKAGITGRCLATEKIARNDFV